MAIEYKCTNCGAMPGRDRLVAKKVLFTGMGAGAKTLRARTVAHLCVTCTKKDEVYNMEPYVAVSEKVRHKEVTDA
jgi:hypothetical protein